MKKLIHKDPETGVMTYSIRELRQIFDALHAYEETGLTPQEVESLKNSYQQLQEINDRTFKSNQDMGQDLKLIKAELEKVKAERDAAVADIEDARPCFACKHFRRNNGNCGGGMRCVTAMILCENEGKEYNGPEWEWRGAKDNNVPTRKENKDD